jgi:hypothetical protein
MPDLTKHWAWNGPKGQTHPGDPLDCEPCRAALLAAFREPADSRYAPMNKPLLPEQAHSTTADVYPHPDRPGGLWQSSCSCGWSREGLYARDGAGEIVAARLAETWASHHLNHPLEGTEDQ